MLSARDINVSRPSITSVHNNLKRLVLETISRFTHCQVLRSSSPELTEFGQNILFFFSFSYHHQRNTCPALNLHHCYRRVWLVSAMWRSLFICRASLSLNGTETRYPPTSIFLKYVPIICIIFVIWIVCVVDFMMLFIPYTHLLHVCLSWKKGLSSFTEVSSIFPH